MNQNLNAGGSSGEEMFSEKEYWERRNHKFEVKIKETGETIEIPAPMRGQTGGTEATIISVNTRPNRRARRRRVIDRTFTKKGYEYGVKIGSKKYNKMWHLVKIQDI